MRYKAFLISFTTLLILGLSLCFATSSQKHADNLTSAKITSPIVFGWINSASDDSGTIRLRIRLATFVRNDEEITGYSIQKMARDTELPVSETATITLQGDPLTRLIDLGLIEDAAYDLPSHRTKTLVLSDLMRRAIRQHHDIVPELQEIFRFESQNGVIVKINQELVP